ncbi:MAG TPA: hypothetical protein VNQ90_21475 [Chthoniobacteraceae bacterium]|nr:hypothetical protein [Chthoniobacteraceae bacterium]
MTFKPAALIAMTLLGFSALQPSAIAAPVHLSPAETTRVGRMIWQNECAGTVEGLVSWNQGEGFPSLGIGHFIWYPKGKRGPFDESFPRLAALLRERGVAMPAWTHGPAPWQTKAEMVRDGARVNALRKLLATPKALSVQTEFLIGRLNAALPKLLAAAPAGERRAIQHRFETLTRSAAGSFALIDYVNFKGEGILATERYRGEGWGLLQVLSGMKDGGDPVKTFSDSAKRVLTRRVKNAPPERKENRWLPGWLNRVGRYAG